MKAGNIIFDTTKKVISRVNNTMSKHSPTILLTAGAVGVVTGVVLAIKAGKEADVKTQGVRDEFVKVHEAKAKVSDEPKTIMDGETGEESICAYTKIDYAKDLSKAYTRLIFAYARVYGPAMLTTLFSLFLIFTSHQILTKRYALTYAGLATMTKAYDSYRKNVIEAEGLEADERYRFGIKTVTEEKPLLDKDGNPKLDKNGNPKSVKEVYDILPEKIVDPRSVLWDEVTAAGFFDNNSSDELIRWRNNVNKVIAAQTAANNILQNRANDPRFNGIGFIYLNEVLNMLGMKPIDIGQIVGWRYDPRLDISSKKFDPYYVKPVDWGDNFVDFGLENEKLPGYELRRKFLSGHEDAVLLYMNYDGEICDKIGFKTIYSKRGKT